MDGSYKVVTTWVENLEKTLNKLESDGLLIEYIFQYPAMESLKFVIIARNYG